MMGCLRQQCIYCLKRDPFCLNTKMIFNQIGNFCVIFEDTRDDCQFPEKNGHIHRSQPKHFLQLLNHMEKICEWAFAAKHLTGKQTTQQNLARKEIRAAKGQLSRKKKAFYGNTHSLTHPTFIVILFNSIAAVGTKCVISTVLVKVLRFDSATRQ